jgi:hypothetical protein
MLLTIRHADSSPKFMCLAADGALVAVKRRVMEPVNKVKILPVYVSMKEILGNGKVMGKKSFHMKKPKPNSDIIGKLLIYKLNICIK